MLAPPAGALGALPLALGPVEDKGASGSAVAVLTGFVAGVGLAGLGAAVVGFGALGATVGAVGLSGTE